MPIESNTDKQPVAGNSDSSAHHLLAEVDNLIKGVPKHGIGSDPLHGVSGLENLPSLQLIDGSSVFNSNMGRSAVNQTLQYLNSLASSEGRNQTPGGGHNPVSGGDHNPSSGGVINATPWGDRKPSLEPIQPITRPVLPGDNRKPAGVDRSVHLRTVDGYVSNQHPDLNLDIRGYKPVNAGNHLIDMGGDEDDKAPQLASLFSRDHGVPSISHTYAVNDWNWGSMSRGSQLSQYEATMVGFDTRPGETLYLPKSGYQIDQAGHQAKVLYVDGDSITVNYTAEGTVASGYTLHLEGIDVDPNLKEGDSVKAGQPLGKARSSEVKVAIRDTGTFMDPRVRKDWWRSYDQP